MTVERVGGENRDAGGTAALAMAREPILIVPSEAAKRSLAVFDPFFGPNRRESETSEFDDQIWDRSFQAGL